MVEQSSPFKSDYNTIPSKVDDASPIGVLKSESREFDQQLKSIGITSNDVKNHPEDIINQSDYSQSINNNIPYDNMCIFQQLPILPPNDAKIQCLIEADNKNFCHLNHNSHKNRPNLLNKQVKKMSNDFNFYRLVIFDKRRASAIFIELLKNLNQYNGMDDGTKNIILQKHGLLYFYLEKQIPTFLNNYTIDKNFIINQDVIRYKISSFYNENIKIYDLRNIQILNKLQLKNECEDVFLLLEYKNCQNYDYRLHFEEININANSNSENLTITENEKCDLRFNKSYYFINQGFLKNKIFKQLIYCDLNHNKNLNDRYIKFDENTPKNAILRNNGKFQIIWNRYILCNNMVKIYEIHDNTLICSEISDAKVNSGFVLISFNSTDFNRKFKYSVIKMDKILVQIDENLQFLEDRDSILHITYKTWNY